jgi:translation initiation factor 2 beta subunit (eIF-2beta)/eIF-5
MPPPIEGSSGHPKRKHGAVSGTGESGSTASQSSAKRPRKFTSSDEKLSDLARIRLRKEACDFFSKNSMQFLEQTYLSSGNAGMDSLKKHLLNLFLLALGSDDVYLRDKKILHYQDRVQDIVQEAIFNPIACYAGVFKSLPIVESAKPDLLLKIERFLAKAGEVKGKGRNTLPKFIQDDLVKKIATQNHQGVIWLLHHAVIVPKDNNRFEGGYGVVRMVEIHEVEAIPPCLEFAGKTMKLKDNLEHHKSRSTEALACPVDHPGVIKVMSLVEKEGINDCRNDWVLSRRGQKRL